MKNKKLNIAKLATLTIEDAADVFTVINKEHPEWGTKRFNFDPVYGHHSHGTGSNSALLFEDEFHFWAVYTKKHKAINISSVKTTPSGVITIYFKDGYEVKTSSYKVGDDGYVVFEMIY